MTIPTPYKPEPIQTQEHSCGNAPVLFFHYQYTTIVASWTIHLQNTSWQITKNKQVAEDIVQEAFLVLWLHRTKIIPENPVGWLIKVVTNLSARYIRDKSIQLRIHKKMIESETFSCTEVEEYLVVKEKYIRLKNIFNQLPAQQKLVLHLSKEKGWKRAEIAACLQLSPHTVRMHLHRAVQFMKENFPCILLFTLLFICNNIFYKNSSTKEAFMEFFTKSYLSSEIFSDNTQTMKLPNNTSWLEIFAKTAVHSMKL